MLIKSIKNTKVHQSPNLRSAYCHIHKKICTIENQCAFLHCAGTLCTAWSPAGLQDGETALSHAHFLAWAGLRRKLEEPLIIQECTDKFPREVFDQVLPQYNWQCIVLDPQQFGWPVRRPRQWCVCLEQPLATTMVLNKVNWLVCLNIF